MRLLLVLAITLLFFSACKDPGTIGSGLLGNEELQINFTDTSLVKARVVPGDSTFIATFYNTMHIGVSDEEIFGNTTNQIFAGTSFSTIPNFEEATLDSIILRIPYSTGNFFGDTLAVNHIEIFQLEEEYRESVTEIGEDLDSSTELAFGQLIGDTMVVANFRDLVPVYKPNSNIENDTLNLNPHLRVRLDNSFGEQFMGIEQTMFNDSIYRDIAKGFLIKNTPSTDHMLPLNFSGDLGGGKLDFFYRNAEDEARCVSAGLGISRFLSVQHDHVGSGSDVEAALDDSSDDQELLYLEPYAGAKIEFDISALKYYQDEIINSVVLEITLADIPGYDYDTYLSMTNLSLSSRDEEGTLGLIIDYTSSSGGVDLIFGGILETNASGDKIYSMNITNHAIQLLKGELPDDYTLTLNGVFENSLPNRSIIHGNSSEGKGPKLKLVITEP